MSKPKIKKQLDRMAKKATEALRENLQGIAQNIARDQEEWIDRCMKDLLRPDIYEKAKHDDCREEVDEYFRKHRIKLTFIPDNMRIRIDVAGRQYSEFVPKFEIDGEPIELKPTQFVADSPSNN